MQIHQLSVVYQSEQDRLLVRVNTTDKQELRLWFTRRLMLGLWPLLNRILGEQLLGKEAAVTSGVAQDPAMKTLLADFRQSEFLQQADFKTPFKQEVAALPLGELPLLVTDIHLTPLNNGAVRMECVEKLQTPEPRGCKAELDLRLLQGLVHLVGQSLAQADWRLDPSPAYDLSAPDTSEQRPKYLN